MRQHGRLLTMRIVTSRFHILLPCDGYRYGHLVKVIPAIYEIPTWLIASFSPLVDTKQKNFSPTRTRREGGKIGMGKARLSFIVFA